MQTTVLQEAAATAPVEFDLHGIVGVRLTGATPEEAARVSRQLGPIRKRLERDPDLDIRYVDRLECAPAALLGVRDAAFDEDSFLVLRGKHKARVRVRIPFETIGTRCEIECERGAAPIPLLLAMVNLTALARGWLPVHASAVRHQGRGILITGWSKGGKTETLLGMLSAGAEYVGDEWIYLDPDGGRMYGIPEPVRVWDWQLAQLPVHRQSVPRAARLRLPALRAAATLVEGASSDTGWRARLAGPADLLDRQCYVRLPPANAFGARVDALHERLDEVVLVVSHESPRYTVRDSSPREVADRIAWSLQEERSDLLAYYRKFRFAFPDRPNPFLDSAARVERSLLERALTGRRCVVLQHPYPPSIPALAETLLKHLDR